MRKDRNYQIIRTYSHNSTGMEELLLALNDGWKVDCVAGSSDCIEYILWNSKK
jgi:hypothetical protein